MREPNKEGTSELEEHDEALLARSRALFEPIPDMIFRIDGEGRYLDFHATDRTNLAFAPEEFLGRTVDEIFDAEFAVTARRCIRMALEHKAMQIWEYSLLLGGVPFDFEARFVPSGNEVVAIIRNITEKKRAQEQLQLTESRLNQAQRVARIGSWERDLTTGQVWWSEETYRLLNYDSEKDQPSYQAFLERLNPDDRPHVREGVEESIVHRKRYFAHHRVILPDGKLKTLNSRANVVLDAKGNAARLVGTIQDVTERIELEQEIIAVGERERERVGRDLHDGLGQTLTGISLSLKALANRLERGQPAPPEVLRQLENNVQEAMNETRRAARLLSPRMAGLRAALEALVTQFDHADLHSAISCETFHDTHDSVVETHLYRVAQEAMSNAAKHSGARNVELRYRCNGKSIRLEVLDDGIGLPKTQKSEGIGLRNMRYRVDMIHGNLDAEDRPGGGTRVVCTCPCR